jgi:uncharacterized membrane protein YdjX (TVP38/TMEM64 family)
MASDAVDRPRKELGRWIGGVVAVVGLGALFYLLWNRGGVTSWMEQSNPLWFFAAMSILPALGVPSAPLYIIAGATFGKGIGLIGSLLALGINATLCYWLAHSRFRPWIKQLLQRFGREIPDFKAENRGGVRFTLMVKLAPGLPTFVKNYALGAAGVPFSVYLGLTMLISGALALAFVVMGESVLEHDLRNVGAAAVAIAVLVGGFWWWRKRRARLDNVDP